MNNIIYIIKRIMKRLGINTARPRLIQLAQGEVSLQGFPKEVADALTVHIKAFDKLPNTNVSSNNIVDAQQITIPSTEMNSILVASLGTSIDTQKIPEYTDKAIGVRFDKTTNRTHLVTVAYDPLSGAAKVDSVYVADGKSDVVTKFKIKAAELNFV